jgi:rod shape-determining protein MreD
VNKQLWKYILLFVLALLFQLTFIRYIEILHWKPDFILIVLVIFSMHYGPNAGSTSGFISGLVGDLVSSHLIGLGALSKSIAGYLSANLSHLIKERGQFILTLIISGFVHNLIYFFISTLGSDFSWDVIIFLYIIPNLFYTTIVGFFINYFLIGWLQKE